MKVSSRYLPSLELGGDCFYYRWFDSDLLNIYMIDVCGHGIRPALLSMSVHNMIRSGSIPESTLIRPDRVLAKLNSLFQMEEQDGAYFTIWYGVYEASTRTLRYANAGHPPALAFTANDSGQWEYTSLTTDSPPVGLFADTEFQTHTYTVPVGCRLMIFSDGVFEIPLPAGELSTVADLAETAMDLLEADAFSADEIIDRMKNRAMDGGFDDDCSVITAEFS